MYVGRCVKATMVFAALAAPGISAIYFAAEDPDSVLDASIAKLFGDEDDPDPDQRSLPQDHSGGDDLENFVDELSWREAELAQLLRTNRPAGNGVLLSQIIQSVKH